MGNKKRGGAKSLLNLGTLLKGYYTHDHKILI
jgi:hypothetical protein